MLAAAVASRTSEQPPQDPIHRPSSSNPYASPTPLGNGRTPSISPLSQTSKTSKIHHDSAIAGDTSGGSPLNGFRARLEGRENDSTAGDNDQRDRSSSLSDIEGSFGEQENDESGTDDALTPAPEEDRDSEAETERVDPTPQKGGNPAKMSLSAPLHSIKEDILSDTDSVRASEDRDSSRQPIGFAGRKRKRTLLGQDISSVAIRSDDSDSDGALIKKRAARKPASEVAIEQTEKSGSQTEERDDATDEIDRIPTPEIHSPSKTIRSHKAKGRSHKKQQPQVQETVEVEMDERDDVEGDADDENGDNLGPEESENRNDAMDTLTGLHKAYFLMRSRMFGDRIADAEAELVQLQQPQPAHTEYIRQLQAVTDRRDTKIQQEMKLHQYKKQALRNQTLGNRSQLLSQYLQEAREIREDILYDLGKQWYDVQKERRAAQSEELEQYIQKFPTKRSEQVRQQTKYNTEVSILSGVAKYVGFPAAPEISTVRPQELDDDMKAMKIMRRQPQPAYQPPKHEYTPRPPVPSSAPTSDHLAQKEFLEQTPWANPHHPVHAQSRTPSAFGHHGLNTQPTPPFSLLNRPTSAFSTPHLGAGPPGGEQVAPGSNDTIGASDPPSSVLAAPPTADRIRLIPFEHGGDISPTAHVKRAPGTKRDFSGLSSASTIDMQPDGAVDHRPVMPMDGPPPHQPFMTSALHSGHGQASQS
ncbi:hypothetical protein K461DRAFT_72051 [Myriangium duriaei CBS 260.36]|uniref:Transcriptional regulatory protein DEP1 n=1 Tax=Myriangium duriaei CBS 260.36 TaxID=1168546 RepID=A0A9P4IT01_9PEZI|nr:hypothetical protein K461DRAFT_72051 [Myriangium duriaei CBS 260.36]